MALLTLVGLGLIVVGGRFFVSGTVDLARTFNVSESVIGLTIVAAGTSMPELVTSMLASYRGHREIAVGNVVGSNLFNLMGVLGLSGLAVDETLLTFDLPIMTIGGADLPADDGLWRPAGTVGARGPVCRIPRLHQLLGRRPGWNHSSGLAHGIRIDYMGLEL